MEQVWVLSRVPGVGSEPRKGPPCAGPAPRRGSQRSLSEDRDVPAGRGGGSGGRRRERGTDPGPRQPGPQEAGQ